MGTGETETQSDGQIGDIKDKVRKMAIWRIGYRGERQRAANGIKWHDGAESLPSEQALRERGCR